MLFGKKKEKQNRLDESFRKVIREIKQIEDWNNPKKIEHYILDSCEQIVSVTKDIEALKTEYRVLTAYLNDIETLKNLPEKEKKEVYLTAKNIEDLERSKNNLKNQPPPLTEEQFYQMSENEDMIPDTILRMQTNEKYQATVERDMKVLEAQKSEYEIERNELLRMNRMLRRMTMLVFVTFSSFLILFFVLKTSVQMDIGLFLVIILFLAAIGIFMIYLRFSSNQKAGRKLVREINKTISLLNVVRMKYANVTNALEFQKENFGVNNSYELNYLWEGYCEMVRMQEQYAQDNDDFIYFSGRLLRLLNTVNLYDKKIWMNQVSALVHEDVMEKVRVDLVQRRKKIRERIAENTKIVKSERDEIDRMMEAHNYYVPEVVEIITSVDKLCGLNQTESKSRQS